MTGHTLTIHADGEEKPCVLIHLGEIDPKTAAITVLHALSSAPKPRKTRSDAGHPKKPATAAA
jgi:hypothetical protein